MSINAATDIAKAEGNFREIVNSVPGSGLTAGLQLCAQKLAPNGMMDYRAGGFPPSATVLFATPMAVDANGERYLGDYISLVGAAIKDGNINVRVKNNTGKELEFCIALLWG